MGGAERDLIAFLETVQPYDSLSQEERAHVAAAFAPLDHDANTEIYRAGAPLRGLYLIRSGTVEVRDAAGGIVSLLGPGSSFGERGLLRDGLAVTTARTTEKSRLLLLPAAEFRRLMAGAPSFALFFERARSAEIRAPDLATSKVSALMTRAALTCLPEDTVRTAAARMRDHRISSLGVIGPAGRLAGIVTVRDLSNRVLAEGRDADAPVATVMTADPITLPPDALGSDVLHLMMERRIAHIPVVEAGRLVGMVTQTDLTRHQAVSSALLVRDAAKAESAAEMAGVTARIPQLLMQLVGGHAAHEVVTRLVTDIADAVTRRLLVLAEREFGPPPVPYLWLACGSQGRQEQTGISDQDNCLFIDDAATAGDMEYFRQLARFVSDGLDAAGYYYCPGDMMATNPKWCQPVSVWRRYFAGWVATPDPMAQMLASVMFDLRPIGGQVSLFRDLQAETLAMASENSIFVAHMISNALKHTPPLGLLRGLATIRGRAHRNHIDMKMSGVIPVVDLARVYALQRRLPPVNTRARLLAAGEAGLISASGARDLVEAYDVIAEARLEHQAAQVRAGTRPDNFLAPSALSDFERAHLRDAFVVVRTMQSALRQGRGGMLG